MISAALLLRSKRVIQIKLLKVQRPEISKGRD